MHDSEVILVVSQNYEFSNCKHKLPLLCRRNTVLLTLAILENE